MADRFQYVAIKNKAFSKAFTNCISYQYPELSCLIAFSSWILPVELSGFSG